LDESAYLASSDDSSNRDEDIVSALKPSLATTNGILALTSSPSLMEGVVHRVHKRHYGPGGAADVIVVQAASRELNPKLSQAVVDRAYEDDPASAESEFGGAFRQAVSAYLTRQIIERAVDKGIGARFPLPGIKYLSFCDVSGGSGTDSFAVAIGHLSSADGVDLAVIDTVLEFRPPFDPLDVVKRAAASLASWNVASVVGDNYAAQWPVTAFAKHGITYSTSPLTKSEIYLHVLPLWTAGRVRLVDNPRLVDQFTQLRRKVGSGGRESVDHVRGSHDDLANATAGVLWRLSPTRRPPVTAGGLVVTGASVGRFDNNYSDTDVAHAAATRHYGDDLIFARPAPGSGADRFGHGGRGY
jgi:hypothetical protein